MLRRIIDRPVAVTMLLLSLVVVGIVCAVRLPVALIPDVRIPQITVQVDAPQMSARQIDESAVRTLRSQLVQIDGLKDITCLSRDGSATLRLTLDHGDDIDYRFIEVNEKIDRAMGSMPNIGRPKVLKASATDIPAFYLNLTSREGGDFLSLSRFAQDVVVRRLEQLDAVAMVDVSGVEESRIMVIPDEARLRQAGLTYDDVARLVSQADVRLGSLTIRDGQYRYPVRFQSMAGSADDIASLWLNHDGHLLQLRDIASIREEVAPRAGMLSSDGHPAVSLAVISQRDARMSDLRKGVSALMDDFVREYPQVSFTLTRDQTALLDYSISNLLQNILVGILLACLVIFLFLRDFRSPVLVAVTIPVSLVLSMLVFKVLGMTLNIVSLSGLLLGVGMMTDNSLVLIDNITGRWQRGDELRRAVIEGTREVMAPMLSAILTTCAVFVPLVSISGIAGALFRDQALAVTIVLFTSYLVTITAVPVYYWLFYKNLPAFRPHPLLERISLRNALEKWDERWSRAMLRNSWAAWMLVGICVVGVVACFRLMPRRMLPELTRDDMLLRVDWNESLTPEENMRRCDILRQEAGADQTTAMAGVQQFALDHDAALGTGEAAIYLRFASEAERLRAETALGGLMARDWPGVPFEFRPAGNLFDLVFGDRESSLVVRLRPTGSNNIGIPALRACLDDLRGAIPDVQIPGVPVSEQVLFVADPEQMALYGIGYGQLMGALRSAMNGNMLLKILQGNRSVPVVLGADAMALSEMLDRTQVSDVSGDRIPLSSLMRRTTAEGLKTIYSAAEGEYYPVALDVPSGRVPEVMSTVRKTVLEGGDFDAGFSGSWFETRRMVRDMGLTVAVAVLLLFLILAAQFESLVQPVIILLEIIIDIFFALALTWACGETINLMSLIGLVVITGIVINDSILKIDTINRLRASGMDIDQAILTAGRRRLGAIIMTSLTTILAVAPFLARGNMGADLQYPMTLVIMTGMAVGTLVSLYVIPALYRSIYRRNG